MELLKHASMSEQLISLRQILHLILLLKNRIINFDIYQ
jgi:hypothetical protein